MEEINQIKSQDIRGLVWRETKSSDTEPGDKIECEEQDKKMALKTHLAIKKK